MVFFVRHPAAYYLPVKQMSRSISDKNKYMLQMRGIDWKPKWCLLIHIQQVCYLTNFGSLPNYVLSIIN